MVLRQLHRQVRAQGVGVTEGLEVQGVHLLQPLCQGVQVGPPLLHAPAVSADADGGEDGVPEPLHGLVLRHIGEHPLRPAGDGDGGDAPGEAAAHLEPVELLEGLAAGLLGPDNPLCVHALEILRVRGGDGQIRRPLPGVVVEKVLPPLRHGVEDLILSVEILHPGQGIVGPVHHHLFAAHGVGVLRAHPGEEGALHRGGDDQPLALLDVQSHPDQKPGVFLEFFIHQFWIILSVL